MRVRHVLLAAPLLLALLPTGAARAAGDPTQGWWNSANTNGATVPATDVPADGLSVAGAQLGTVTSQVPPAVTGNIPPLPVPANGQSVAAVRFPLVGGEVPSVLTLTIASTAPVASTTVQACRATAEFAPVYNGQGADAPPSDCSITSIGMLSADMKTVTFSGLDRLADADHISIVLVPGGADRIAFAHVTGAALTTVAGQAPFADAPATFDAPATAPDLSSGPSIGGSVSSAPIGGATGTPTAPTPDASGSSGTSADSSNPATPTGTTAPAAAQGSAGAADTAAGAARTPTRFRPAVAKDTSRSRALGVLLLLVVVAAYGAMELQRGDRRPRLIGPLAGNPMAAAAADVVAAANPVTAAGPKARGVGRFKTPRVGAAAPPRL